MFVFGHFVNGGDLSKAVCRKAITILGLAPLSWRLPFRIDHLSWRECSATVANDRSRCGNGPRTISDWTKVTQKKPSMSATAALSTPLSTDLNKVAVSSAKPVIKSSGSKVLFKTSEFIVYPAHGVGQITEIEEQEVAGFKLELYVISFVKDKMTLKVPTPKVASVGMRKLAEADVVKKALDTLTGRARIKRTMWSRRAQEYEAKINSGDLVSIAEVVRDLYRSDIQPEQSYSERQLYEAALDRMAREISAVQKLCDSDSLKLIEAQLQKSPRRITKAEESAIVEEGDVEEAA
jgi:CarD family transcriptional regulator